MFIYLTPTITRRGVNFRAVGALFTNNTLVLAVNVEANWTEALGADQARVIMVDCIEFSREVFTAVARVAYVVFAELEIATARRKSAIISDIVTIPLDRNKLSVFNTKCKYLVLKR